MVPLDSDGISPVPPYSGYPSRLNQLSAYGALTLSGRLSHVVQSSISSIYAGPTTPHCRNRHGLGSSAFARHYLRNHCYFLFLRVLRCFSSPGLPPLRDDYSSTTVGCPIRTSADQFVCADPRGFSQLITSFLASESLGIPRAPLFTYS